MKVVLVYSYSDLKVTNVWFSSLIELPDFLDESECNHIINSAEKVGLRGSDVHLDGEVEKRKEVVRGQKNFKPL